MKLDVNIKSEVKKVVDPGTSTTAPTYRLTIACEGTERDCEKVKQLLFDNMEKNIRAL